MAEEKKDPWEQFKIKENPEEKKDLVFKLGSFQTTMKEVIYCAALVLVALFFAGIRILIYLISPDNFLHGLLVLLVGLFVVFAAIGAAMSNNFLRTVVGTWLFFSFINKKRD
jgi:membrane protein required for beta-lactamase induction